MIAIARREGGGGRAIPTIQQRTEQATVSHPIRQMAGSQDDAKALAKAGGTTWALVEVAVDKAGLLAFLNDHRVGATPIAEPRTEPPRLAPISAQRDMSAGAMLARMDNPGIDVDAICETIGKTKGYALKRFASAVAIAFQGLAA